MIIKIERTQKMKTLKRTLCGLLVMALAALSLAGCAKDEGGSSETVGESTGESSAVVAEAGTPLEKINPEDTALTVGDYTMSAEELFYLYYSTKLTYELSYGFTDWSEAVMEGYTYGDYLKTNVESQALNMAYLLQKAEEMDLELTEEEKTSCLDNAQLAMSGLDEETLAAYGFTQEGMTAANEDMLLASNAMAKLQEEAEANLTEEEKSSCQYRAIQHILISTMDTAQTGADGATETMDSEAAAEYKESQKALAEKVLERAKAGEDFEALANEYTADSGVDYSINAAGQTPDGATMVTEFAEAANALGEGEISDLVETQYGYHIIKCVALNDEEANAQAIQNLAYQNTSSAYSEWLSGVTYNFYDTWKNYVIVNPTVPETDAESSADTDLQGGTGDSVLGGGDAAAQGGEGATPENPADEGAQGGESAVSDSAVDTAGLSGN